NPPEDLGGPYSFFFDRGCYHGLRLVNVQAYFRTLERFLAPSAVGLVLTANPNEPMEDGPKPATEDEYRADWAKLWHILWTCDFRFDARTDGGVRPLGWSCFVRRR